MKEIVNKINVTKLRRYCIDNCFCTGMSNLQYKRLFDYASNQYRIPSYCRDIAVMIKICSGVSSKTIDEIADDLEEMRERYEIQY